jgi:[ribosomal protein S5]-alanine N-acetyltransferase
MLLDCKRCLVRSWRATDVERLPVHANNRNLWLNLRDRFPHPYTSDDAVRWIEHVLQIQPETNFAIDVGGEAVGGIGVVLHEDVERCSAEIGYWLGERYWGHGIASAAVGAFTAYAFDAFRLTRIYALPFAHNRASARVLEKAGYRCEGTLRRSAIKDGVVLDQLMYAMTDVDRSK